MINALLHESQGKEDGGITSPILAPPTLPQRAPETLPTRVELTMGWATNSPRATLMLELRKEKRPPVDHSTKTNLEPGWGFGSAGRVHERTGSTAFHPQHYMDVDMVENTVITRVEAGTSDVQGHSHYISGSRPAWATKDHVSHTQSSKTRSNLGSSLLVFSTLSTSSHGSPGSPDFTTTTQAKAAPSTCSET